MNLAKPSITTSRCYMHTKSENNVRLAVNPEAHIDALCYNLRTMNATTELHRMALKVCPDESHKTPPSLSYNASLTKSERERTKERKQKVQYTSSTFDHRLLVSPSSSRLACKACGVVESSKLCDASSVSGSHVCDACSAPLSHCSRWKGWCRLCLFRCHCGRHLLPIVLLRLHHCTIRFGHTRFADRSAAT